MKRENKKLGWLLAMVVSIAALFGSCQKDVEMTNSLQDVLDEYLAMSVFLQENILLGGSDTTINNRAHALAAMVSYGERALTGAAGDIDLIYDRGSFWNDDPNSTDGRRAYGSKFALTSVTPQAFADDFDEKADVLALRITPALDQVELQAGKVYYVLTKKGYRALIHVKEISASKKSVLFDYKVCLKD